MISFLHSFEPSRVVFSLGPVRVYWYGLLFVVGISVGYAIAKRLWKKYIPSAENDFFDIAFWMLVAGIAGARLYHVLNEIGYYTSFPGEIFALWKGGLAIHGGIIGAAVAGYAAARRRKFSFLRLSDIFAPALAWGQAIGRWGNYFNQELYGAPTSAAWGIPIAPEFRVQGYEEFSFFHPVFLYESIGLAALGAVLLWMHARAQKGARPGAVIAVYLFGAGIVRVMSEILRIDDVPLVGDVRLPLLVSVGMALVGGALMAWRIMQESRTR